MRERRLQERRSASVSRSRGSPTEQRSPQKQDAPGSPQTTPPGGVDLNAVSRELLKEAGGNGKENVARLEGNEDAALYQKRRSGDATNARGEEERTMKAELKEGENKTDSLPQSQFASASKQCTAQLRKHQAELAVAMRGRGKEMRERRLQERRSASVSRSRGSPTEQRSPQKQDAPGSPQTTPPGGVDLNVVSRARVSRNGEDALGCGSLAPVLQTPKCEIVECKKAPESSHRLASNLVERSVSVVDNKTVHLRRETELNIKGAPRSQMRAMPLSVDGASSELYPDASRSVPRPGASGLQVIPKSSCASKEDPQSGGLVDEIAGSQGHQRAFRTPTWEKQTGQPVAKAGSPLSPQSPHASVRLVGASTAASKSTTERAMRPIPCRSEEKQKDEWMLQHEAHLELLHRQAAARLIQHAWRQHRLGVLFSSVLQMKRRRAESARNRRRSNGLVPFTEKTSEALSRTVELSASLGPRGSQDDITEVQQRRDLYEQFIPIIEENKPPAPVVLFKAGSKNLLSRHLSAEDPKRAEGPSHKAKEKAANQEASEKPRASTEFLQDISDSGSPRNNQSERLPEIVLQLASSSSSSPKRSSHSSDSSSQRSSSDLSRSSLEDEIGRSGKHEYDDFDVRKRLRQIMREGLDSRMRSTLAGSDVLLPRASRIGWTSSPSQKEQYMPAIAGLGVQNALSKRSDRQKYSLSKIGTQRSVICVESLKTETKSPGQKDMKNVSQDRRESHLNVFLHPDWQERKLESLNALRALPPTKALEKKASRPPPVSVSRYGGNSSEPPG
ncbi:uncharacterized protein LOC113147644 [Cyclospora cayetanensis]|uniref:Uncharacterized protein LOC113147644 n=1 Tax=Cyclospora cayetanensis TaxID=88456 RepID=A0A6P6S4D7_9EIME|nr:uncharacterized protein LOC113147644 [Cyclospora cayetanensis]